MLPGGRFGESPVSVHKRIGKLTAGEGAVSNSLVEVCDVEQRNALCASYRDAYPYTKPKFHSSHPNGFCKVRIVGHHESGVTGLSKSVKQELRRQIYIRPLLLRLQNSGELRSYQRRFRQRQGEHIR